MQMTEDLPSKTSSNVLIVGDDQFHEWTSLNDTIMGGNSHADCTVNSDGLLLDGTLVEEGGGFVSCRSPILDPPLNLSKFQGLTLEVDGYGRTLKFALTCRELPLGFDNVFAAGLKWIYTIPTKSSGTTSVDITFRSLKPTVRAKAVRFPFGFNSSLITQFQLLHSKFGEPGELNPGFIPGPINILLRSISAF